MENYYNVINGYKELFLDTSKMDEDYLEEATFEEIYALYDFDRAIRNTIFEYILQIENTLRTQIAYVFSELHGCENYIRFENFENLSSIGTSERKQADRAYKIHNLISSLQSDLARSINKKDYIRHYVIHHGYVPLWVLVNAITLGRLSSFYTLMKQAERIEVSKHWNVMEIDLTQYIQTLAFYRNLCAHDERLYNSQCKSQIPNHALHEDLDIDKTDKGEYIYGKKDLFSLMIVFKILLPKEEFRKLYN